MVNKNLKNLSVFLKSIIKEHETVLVKEFMKKHVLSNLIPNCIIYLEVFNCPNIKMLKYCNNNNNYHCNSHKINNLLCARENVNLFSNWYKNNHCTNN